MYVTKSTQELAALYLKDAARSRYLSRDDVRGRMLNLPICPKCERPVLKDKGWRASGIVQCITQGCGWRGPVDKTLNVDLYLRNGGNGA